MSVSLLVVFGFLLYVWFSRRFFCFSKNPRENNKTQKTNPYPRVGLKPLTTVFVGFPQVCLVFFGLLWYVWFSRRFFWFSKNPRENQTKTKNNKPMGSFQISEISEISYKKHYAFEFWCLECSSLGPTAKISIHLSNSVWLVCVGFCIF